MPLNKLFGKSPTGMNSSSKENLTDFYDFVERERSGDMQKNINTLIKIIYKSKYGKAPTWPAAYGYDAVMELSKAVEAAKFNPSKMRGYFEGRKTDGAIGRLEFDKTADPTSELELVSY